MIFLIDHNLKGHALVLFGAIASQGWLDIVPIRFVTFSEMELSIDSDDRVVWQSAQKNQMILLTANRSMKGKNPLETDTSQRGKDARRLIDAGIEIFGIYGYEAASTRSLAEKAGVNLAAIPYYFGGKAGLYRAVAEHVAGDVEQLMAAITQKIAAALKQPHLSRADTLVLLQELIDTFAMGIIASEPDDHSTRFIMREQLDPTSAFDIIYENVMLKVLRPCEALISRLLEKPEDDPECIIQAFTILGQVLIFRLARTAALRRLDWDKFTDERVKLIRAVVQQHFDGSVYRNDDQ